MKLTMADGTKLENGSAEHRAWLAAHPSPDAMRRRELADRTAAGLATERQLAYLRDLGIDNIPANLSVAAASRLISEATARRIGGCLGYGEDQGDNAVQPPAYEGNLNREVY